MQAISHPAGANGLKNHAFLRRDVEEFLSGLMAQADERYSDDPCFHLLGKAQKRVMCGVEAIVRLLLDGKLRRVGKRIGLSGYGSLLVDAAELERLVDRPELHGVPLKDVAAALSCHLAAAIALVANGHLAYSVHRGPKNNLPRKIISVAELRHFDAEYVSLRAISNSSGVHPLTMLRRLEKAGVAAAIPSPMNFYRRSEVNLPKFEGGHRRLPTTGASTAN